MKISRGELQSALQSIGEHPEARESFLEMLRTIEQHFETIDFDPREEIIGPIADALFPGEPMVEKTLASGTVFHARYTSKITRDFMLAESPPEFVWEPQTSKALLELCAGARHVLIGGAYIGDHAVLIADKIAPEGKVHCFEPSADSAELLLKNASANNLTNLIVNQMGLWGRDERLILVGDDSHAFPKLAEQAEGEGSFAATSVDAYCEKHSVEKLDLIQLDIEGGEFEALQGARSFLSMDTSDCPTVIFEIHSSYTDWSNGLEGTDVVRFVESFGYEVFAIRDYNGNEVMTGRPVELVPVRGAYIQGPPHGFNLLAVKDRARLTDSSFRIVSDVSPKLLKHRDPKLHAPIH